MRFLYYFLFPILISLTTSQNFPEILKSMTNSQFLVNAKTEEVYGELGESVNILVRASPNKIISYCHWISNSPKLSNTTGFHFVNDQITSGVGTATEDKIVKGYEKFGKGLSEGECGFTINRIDSEDFTRWSYTYFELHKNESLISDENKPEAVQGTVQLTKPVRPSPPVILNKENANQLVDKKLSDIRPASLDLSCCSKGGRPDPVLKFKIGDLEINSTRETPSTPPENTFCIHWIDPNVSWEQNGLKLICTSEHITTHMLDQSLNEDSVPLQISYCPIITTQFKKSVDGSVKLFVPENQELSIDVEYSANPEPVVEISQYYGGNFIQFGSVDPNDFSSSTSQISPSKWRLVIKMSGSFIKSNHPVIKLGILNHLGRDEIIFNVLTEELSSEIPKKEDEGGFNWLWVVIPLIFFFIIIAVAVFIWVSKRNALFCWRNRRQSYIPPTTNVYNPVTTQIADPADETLDL